MAKHPVPKRKTSKSHTRIRHSAFRAKTVKKLLDGVRLVPCDNCGVKRLSHHVCTACGMYRGRQVLKIKSPDDKVTKIKA